MDRYVPGTFYSAGGRNYVIVNTKGTVEKLPSAIWWRVLALSFLQFLGRKSSVIEVKEFLYPGRML